MKIVIKNPWKIFTIVLLAVVSLLSLVTFNRSGMFVATDVPSRVMGYINENLVRPGTEASLVSVNDLGDVYEIITLYMGERIPVYATKDGKYIFMTMINMSESTEEKGGCESIPKAEEPQLEAFVVSYCPFGLQMERVLSEIVKNIPEAANYIKVRYIGSIEDGKIYSMHGEKEAEENLRQICIREEYSEKFWDYVSCFIKSGDYSECLKDVGISEGEINDCMENRGLDYAEVDFELMNTYNIRGSPTLVLNGIVVDEFEFGGRSAEAVKEALCCGFSEKPGFCETKLTEEQASTGFSETYSSSGGSSGKC